MRYVPDITSFDYILGFCYILVFTFLAYAYKERKSERDPNYNYYMIAFSAKMASGLGFMFLTVYYWGGGDTYSYFNTARDLVKFSLSDPQEGLRILFASVENMNWYKYDFAFNRHDFLKTTPSFTTVKITALVNLFCFNSYVISSIVFGMLSFLGVWNMYYVFCRIYPHLKKPLFYSFFFIPTVMLWGSGILKDTITLSCIGWIVYSFINLVLLKRKQRISILLILIATFFLFLIKPYILYILYPSLFFWVQSNLKQLIKNNLLRQLFAPLIAVVLLASAFLLSKQLSQDAGRYSLDRMQSTLEGFQTWHTTVAENKHQSGYSLGEMDFSMTGIVKKIPAAIAVTFFRPYVWEASNASTLLGAVEGMILSGFCIWLILKYRLNLFRIIFRNKDILFLLIFSLTFGVSVGISSYNFGALSRYKIPAQMFFVTALVLIYDKTNKIDNRT